MRRVSLAVSILSGIVVFVLSGLLAPAVAGKKKEEHLHIPQVSPEWNLRFKGIVKWQRVTPLGTLIIATEGALHGVNPSTGRVVWRHSKLGLLPEDAYSEIDGTSMIVLEGERVGAGGLILDSIDGRVIFSARRAGFASVVGRHLLPRIHGLLIEGVREKGGARALVFVDVATGKVLWAHNRLLGVPPGDAVDVKGGAKNGSMASALTATPIEIDTEVVLIATRAGLYSLDARNGKVYWKSAQPKGVVATQFTRRSDTEGVVFVSNEVRPDPGRKKDVRAMFGAYHLSDGASVWSGLLKLEGRPNKIVFHDDGLLLSARSDGRGPIRLVEATTGRTLWYGGGPESPLPGSVVDVALTTAGVVVLMAQGADEKKQGSDQAKEAAAEKVAARESKKKKNWLTGWMKGADKDEEFLLNVLDMESGAPRFKDSLKVRGRLLSAEAIPSGIVYVTTSDLNVVDPETGATVSKKPIRSNETLITTDTERSLFAFSSDDGTLYRLDRESGRIEKLSNKKIKLEGDDVPMALEVSDDAIVLLAMQNVVVFERDGTLRFHAHHEPPEALTWRAPLLKAQAV
ncbi:MAG: PQQ-binding-like beta-propeller repeat protein, partial [Acidobacteria bacterium]|nr:PQQ-binding-like beta-propeller repeat protein [Acidobacteriota bacterium]